MQTNITWKITQNKIWNKIQKSLLPALKPMAVKSPAIYPKQSILTLPQKFKRKKLLGIIQLNLKMN